MPRLRLPSRTADRQYREECESVDGVIQKIPIDEPQEFADWLNERGAEAAITVEQGKHVAKRADGSTDKLDDDGDNPDDEPEPESNDSGFSYQDFDSSDLF